MKEYLIISLIWIGIGLVIIAVAYFFKSPVFIAIGLSIVITYIVIPIIQKITKNEDDEALGGCGCMLIIAIGACTLLFSTKEYYVSGLRDKRHYYEDCEYKDGNKSYYKVSELGTILMGCLPDCEGCKNRYDEEKEQRKAEWKQKQLQSDIEDIEKKIEILQNVLSRLKKGETIDVSDYDFRNDVEVEIEEEREELGNSWEYLY